MPAGSLREPPTASTKPGALTRSPCSSEPIAASTASRCGPSPKMTPERPGTRSAASATARDDARRVLLRDQAPGEDHQRFGDQRLLRLDLGAQQTAKYRHLAARALRRSLAACSSDRQKARLMHAGAAMLHRDPDPSRGAEVAAPVLARPDLEPVDDQRVAARAGEPAPRPAARSTGTTRCARRRSGGRDAAGATARRRRSRAAARCAGGRRRCRAPCAARSRRRARRGPPAPRRGATGAS